MSSQSEAFEAMLAFFSCLLSERVALKGAAAVGTDAALAVWNRTHDHPDECLSPHEHPEDGREVVYGQVLVTARMFVEPGAAEDIEQRLREAIRRAVGSAAILGAESTFDVRAPVIQREQSPEAALRASVKAA